MHLKKMRSPGHATVVISKCWKAKTSITVPMYLGALPIYKNGELSIMINDNVKNKGITDIEEVKSMGNYNKAVPALFTFDKSGNISRKDPEEAIKDGLVLRPGVSYEVSDNEYIIYSARKKSDKLGRMILD